MNRLRYSNYLNNDGQVNKIILNLRWKCINTLRAVYITAHTVKPKSRTFHRAADIKYKIHKIIVNSTKKSRIQHCLHLKYLFNVKHTELFVKGLMYAPTPLCAQPLKRGGDHKCSPKKGLMKRAAWQLVMISAVDQCTFLGRHRPSCSFLSGH